MLKTSAILFVLEALATAPSTTTATTLRFEDAGALVENGILTASGSRALLGSLREHTAAAAVTITVCIGPEHTTTVEQAKRLGRSVARLVRGRLTKAYVSSVIRSVPRSACPGGVTLTIPSFSARGAAAEAKVLAASGSVMARLGDKREVPLETGSVIPEAAELHTGAGARCTVALPNGTQVKLRENTSLALSKLAEKKGTERRKTELRLLVGRLWSRVVKAVGGTSEASLEISSPNAVAGVRGTEFQMGVGKQEQVTTNLAVYSGAMGLAAGGKEIDVPAGFSVSAAGDELGDLVPLPAAPAHVRPRSGEFPSPFLVTWEPVAGAAGYRLEIATDPQFVNVVYSQMFPAPLVAVESPPGEYYWRVTTVTADGTESLPSKLYRITIVATQ